MPKLPIGIPGAELVGDELVGDEPVGDGTWRIRRYRLDLPPEVAGQVQAGAAAPAADPSQQSGGSKGRQRP